MSSDHGQTAPRRRHTPAGGPDDGEIDWFKWLDIAVWIAVTIIVILAVEWLAGHIIRETIARGAQRHLAKVNAGDVSPESEG